MRIFRQSLSMLLCLVLTFSAVPWSALAEQADSTRTIRLPEAPEATVTDGETTAEIPVNTKNTTAKSDFVFVEPGRENDEPVGDVIITDQGYRVQMNPDLQSYTIVEYFGSEKNVVIPSKYNGLPITRIGSYAFLNRAAVQTVRIPETVTRMETDVFAGCKSLQYNEHEGGKYLGSENNPYYYYCGPVDEVKATITEAAMHIDTKIVAAFAFRGCTALRSVVVPDGVKQVGYGMVFGCELESITLPFVGELGADKNPQFGWVFGARSFGGNISYVPMSLKTVVITGGADGKQGKIAQGAFYGVDMIEEISLPFLGGYANSTSNTYISWYWGASGYTQNILPPSLKYLTIAYAALRDGNAFYNCSSLENITILSCTASIGSSTFYGCDNLKSVIIPDSITSIGYGAFSGCKSLESMEIPEGVTAIAQRTFWGCNNLKNITIPKSITVIEEDAFYSCEKIENVYISDVTAWCGIAFQSGNANPMYSTANLYLNGVLVTDLKIPAGVTAISNHAFRNCNSLERITLSEGLTSIGTNAFSQCANLISISVPNSVMSIGNYAFYNCSSLTDITIPAGVTSVGEYTFYGCSSLRNVYLPTAMTTIGTYAFFGCSSLESIAIPEGVTALDSETFSGCGKLRSVTLPDSLTKIGYKTFYECISLRSIVIPKNVISIGYTAFGDCSLYQVTNQSELALEIGSYEHGDVARNAKILVNADGSISYQNGSAGYEYFETSDGFLVEKYNETYKLIAYMGDKDTITLPLNIDGKAYKVYGLKGARNVIIPEGFTAVDAGAFYNCTDLVSVTIPDSVKQIGDDAFGNCSSLESIEIPKSVTSIGLYVFRNCTSLTSIVIPEGVTIIRPEMFSGCTSLKSVTIPSSVTSVGDYAFKDCTGLENLYIQDVAAWCKIQFYGSMANPLNYAQNLYVNGTRTREVIVPESITTFKSYTFYAPYALDKLTLNSKMKSLTSSSVSKNIRVEVDSGNPYLQVLDGVLYDKPATKILHVSNTVQAVNIPEGVTAISDQAFYGCRNLESVVIPDGVTSIGYSAFYNCGSLKSITIPDTVTSIYSQAFYGCTSLTEIVIPEGVTTLSGTFNLCTSLTSVTIPQSVTSIGTNTFLGCSSLTSIMIPESVTSIGTSAFYGCTNLKSITIPEGITSISNQMFAGCSSLESIVIPKNVTSIGSSAFSGCSSLKNIVIPEGVTTIGNSAFYNCISLQSITISESVTTIGSRAFNNCSSLASIVIPKNVTSIGQYAFSGCNSLKMVVLSEGITSVSNYAFYNCSGMECVTLPESLTAIGNYAFYNCASLKYLTLPKNVTSIGSQAFYQCTSLYKVTNNSALGLTIGSSNQGYAAYYAKILVNADGNVSYRSGYQYVETADGFLFQESSGNYYLLAYLGHADTVTLPLTIDGKAYRIYQMRGVKHVVIPEGFTTVNDEAFYNCLSLRSVTLPEGMQSIGYNAFCGCSNLESINFPASLTTIGRQAFWGCSLQTVCIDGMVDIGDHAFQYCSQLHTVEFSGIKYIRSTIFNYCTNLSQIYYGGDENEWRHVLKASDWDEGMPNLTIHYKENTGLLYETNEDRTEFYISGVDSQQAVVTPPTVYSGRPVVAVLSNAFNGSQTVESITLPESVVHVGEKAFANCTGLKDIQFPSGLQEMAQGVLTGCNALQELNLPFLGSTVTDTENAYLAYTFGGYTYQDNASYVPENLATVTVDKGEKIFDHAFENCARLQQVNLPAEATEIGDYAFSGCTELEQIALPAGLTQIGDYAFSGCASMEIFQLPTQLAEIGDYGFRGCDSLKTLDLPDSVKKVGVMLLDGCNSLTSITIGAGLSYDGIADTHNQVNSNPFFGLDKSASRLSTYTVAAENPDFIVQDNILYRKMDIDGQPVEVEIVDAPAKANLSNYQMPESIVKIGAYAFAYNNTLRSIDLNYVRMVGNNAFYRAENLIYAQFGVPTAAITLPEGVKEICYNQFVGREAFAGCTALQRVNLDSPTLLGVEEGAFADCSALATVNLGENIRYIGIGAFGSSGSGAPVLSAIHVDDANAYFESQDGVLYQKNADGTLTLLVYPAMSSACEVKDGKTVFYVPAEKVTGVESYAFRMAQNLDEIYLNPQQEMRIGDYAFANTMLEKVYVGENVVSLGLKRGEGEYTVFADSNELVAVEVAENNRYYSSQNGVLFDKNATKLIKYPAAKAGNLYELPDTVRMIASMAFKNNNHLQNVRIRSQVDTVGLEAFYSCSSLSMIFFDGVYAPTSVLENAFTTYDSLNENPSANPRTLLGYSQGYYLDGENGEYGWSNYADVYNLALCEALPESEGRTGNHFYAVVVVDSHGNRINNMHVTLTDPNGVTETVATGSNGASNGVAMFYHLFGSAGMGFSLVYDGTYCLEVTDPAGEYFTYANPSFYLDEDMRITYVTVTMLPSIYGTTCGETDINTESAEINKAEYGYTNVELIDESLGFTEDNIKTSAHSEYLDISVISYCDSKSGWSFVDAQGNALDPQTDGLYQNGIKVCDITSVQVQDGSVLFTFHVDVAKLVPEVQLEARLKAFDKENSSFVCSTVLNIHVFDFVVTEDDVNLDTQELEIDLAGENALLAKLFGSPKLDVKLGKNLSFGVAVDGSRVEMTLGGKGSKSISKSGVGSYPSYEKGYEANHEPHNKNTYFFQFKDTYKDENGVKHYLTYNVRFARGTEESNYFYYRCYVYEGKYENEVAKFYGAVNGLNDTLAKAIGAKTYRERVAPKALLIYKTCSLTINKQAKTVKDIDKVASNAAYIEAIAQAPSYSNEHSFDVELSGKLIFEYDKENGLKPVSSEIHGELYYTFKHNSQFVVWVIPVVLEVEVKVGGEVDITLKFDENRGVSFEEAQLQLSAAISAKVGVGCSVASVGVYGSIGTVFVLEFYPDFGIDSWTLNGEIGAYMKILWYTKKFSIAKFNNVQLMNDEAKKNLRAPSSAEMFLVENYSSENLDNCEGNARILSVDDQIYKIFYVDASSMEGYDQYNYRKLAVAVWNGTDWSNTVIIDNNFRNDASYDLYSIAGKTYVVYTQQAEQLDESSVDDTYVSSSNMVIKVADITDPENVTVTTVHSGEHYKYLPTMTQVGDELTVVWAENADNNMFGVSPYNYIDANGQSHVFETTANAIYISVLRGEQWQAPVAVKSGLSAVTDVAVAEDGSICFVVDQNGDLGDAEDRLLYTASGDLQTITAVNSLTNGSVTGVDADGDDYIYYLQSNKDTVLSGFRWLYATDIDTIPQVADFGENYRILRDDTGNIAAIFYIGVKTWEEAGKTVDGSAMYAVFCNDGVWGLPVEIGTFPAQKDVYISYFDVLYNSDSSVMVVADFVDENGMLLYQLTESDVSMEAELSVEDYEIDYVNRILHITLVNQGAKTAQVYTAVDDGARVVHGEAITSGNRQTISVPLSQCGNIEPDVHIYDSEAGTAICTIDDIDLNYADVVPMSKQLLLGEENNLLIGVKNTGVLKNAGYLIIRPGNYDAETIEAYSLVEAALEQQNVQVLPENAVVFVNHESYGQFWVVKVTAEPGAVTHYEITLTEAAFAKAEGLFSIFAYVDASLEKGDAAANNMTYLAYQQLTGVLTKGEEITIVPQLQTDNVEFDTKIMDAVSVDFSCGADNSVVSVSGVQWDMDYQVTFENGKGSLTILKDGFDEPGTYHLVIGFAGGESCRLSVVVPQYHKITWMANGKELCVTEVKHGNMPYLSSNPVKEGVGQTTYKFLGWSVNAGGTPIGIQAATQDTTYYAVWGENDQVYEVTWVFINENGKQTVVSEQYAYNKLPEYLGKIPAPANKVFANWDKPISAVTENTTYTAVYKKAVLGSATISNTAFETAPGMSFITTLHISDVQDLEESVLTVTYNTDAVTLLNCVCRENVTLVEQGSDYLVFSLGLEAGQTTAELADLTFKTNDNLEEGEIQFLEAASEDFYLPVWNDILIRGKGELPGSGMVDQWNVSLDDDLQVNFYIKLSEGMESKAKIQITVGEETVLYRASELPKAVNGSYIASVSVSAAQMTDYIMVVIMDGGKILGMSTYTVRQYADAILAEDSFSRYHPLVKEMLNYGGQAQAYFNHETENLANVGIVGVGAQEIPEAAEEVVAKGAISGVRFYGASLVNRDKIAVRYYFTITGNVMNYAFTANGNSYTPVLKDGMYYVEIDGILPQNLDQQITLTVTDAEENQLSVTYGPMNYIVRMNQKGDDGIKALLKALYNYHLAAKTLRTVK